MVDADRVDDASMVGEAADGVAGLQRVEGDALAAGDHFRAHDRLFNLNGTRITALRISAERN